MGPEPARYSLAQLVYTVVLKTLTKEALSSVTSPTPLIKYFISNLQLETKKQNKTVDEEEQFRQKPPFHR